MNYFRSLINENMEYAVLIIIIIFLIFLIWNLIVTLQLARLSKKYKRFMRNSTGKNMEAVLEEFMGDVKEAIAKTDVVENRLEKMTEQLDRCVQKWNVLRYNAFSDTGSDLSYSIALLDNYYNGFILTGIYGRNETINYAKPIISGESKYPLSVEEQLVLDRCMKKTGK
ncbi:MAG: DUF4446 family protein [Bacillota bacterium]